MFGEKHKNNILWLGMVGVGLSCMTACQEMCPQSDDVQVPEHGCIQDAPSAAPITLSSLDADARARLKQEVMDEVQEELKAQWEAEWRVALENKDVNPDHMMAVCQKIACNTACRKDALSEETGREASDKMVEKSASAHTSSRKRRPPIELPPTQPIEKDERGLKIMRQAFATQIVRRLPVDERETFTIEDGSIFCFVEVSSNEENERLITLKFTHSTGMTQSYALPIGQSPAWRTWSKLNLTSSMTGAWLCEVFNEAGVLLASKSFTVE